MNNLASDNEYRKSCGFQLRSIEDLTSDPDVRKALRNCYGPRKKDISKVELFPVLFAEDVSEGSTLPPLMGAMVAVDAFSQALHQPPAGSRAVQCDDIFARRHERHHIDVDAVADRAAKHPR